MKRFFRSLAAFLAIAATAAALTGCGRIQTGNVGLRTDFNGTVSQKVENEGFYTAVVSHVDEYTTKEIGVDLDNLTPKAADNLSMKDMDVTVFYRVNPEFIRPLAVKRTNMSLQLKDKTLLPAWFLVKSVSESETGKAVAKVDSLVVHTHLDELATDIKARVQHSLNESDPGAFVVTRVVIRRALTDPTIENSIRNVVSKEKELEAAKLQVQVAQANAEATAKTAQTLTPAFLQHEYNQVLSKFAEKGGTIILDGSSSSKILNLAK